MLAVVALLVVGCGKKEQSTQAPTTGGEQKKVRIVLVTNGNSPFWDPMEVGAKKAAEELGCEVISRRPTTDSPALQRQIIEEYQAQKVDGIGISVIESDTTT